MKGILIAVALLAVIVYGILRPDQFAEAYNLISFGGDYFQFLLSKNYRQLASD